MNERDELLEVLRDTRSFLVLVGSLCDWDGDDIDGYGKIDYERCDEAKALVNRLDRLSLPSPRPRPAAGEAASDRSPLP